MFGDTDTLLVLVKPKTRDIIIARKSYELMNISARPALPLSLSPLHIPSVFFIKHASSHYTPCISKQDYYVKTSNF